MRTLIIFLSFLLLSSSETLTGKVVKVADGDTITILTKKNERIRIRFSGIDCPEKSQAFGQKAKEFTKTGMAWHYEQYDKSKELADPESQARREKIGLCKSPIVLREFRRMKKKY